MRDLLAACYTALVAWIGYSIGFGSGKQAVKDEIRARTELLASILEATQTRLATVPTVEQCIPVMKGVEVDEYSFCVDLLNEQAQIEQDARQEAERDREG